MTIILTFDAALYITDKKETHTVKISIFLKAVNVKQILFASFSKHFIGSFIVEISFRKINLILAPIKLFSNQIGINLQNHKNIVSAEPFFFSVKRNNETNS